MISIGNEARKNEMVTIIKISVVIIKSYCVDNIVGKEQHIEILSVDKNLSLRLLSNRALLCGPF